LLQCAGTSSLDKTIHIWDLNTTQQRSLLQFQEGVVRVRSIPNNPNVFAAATLGGEISFWDFRTSKNIKTINAHSRPILDISIFDNELISGSEDQTIKIWDIL